MWNPRDSGSSGKSGSCTASLQLSPRHCCTALASDASIATASWCLATASVELDTWRLSVCDRRLSMSTPVHSWVGSLTSDPSTGGNTRSQCCSLAIILLIQHIVTIIRTRPTYELILALCSSQLHQQTRQRLHTITTTNKQLTNDVKVRTLNLHSTDQAISHSTFKLAHVVIS